MQWQSKMTQFQMQNNVETQYAQIVISNNAAEFQPSRLTRPSDTPALQLGFIPNQLMGKPALPIRRQLNYPQIEIGARPVIEAQPPRTPEPSPAAAVGSPGGDRSPRRRHRTLEHRRLSQRSSVLSMAQQLEGVNETGLPKSRSLNRLRSSEVKGQRTRRTSVREMAQLYDTMARDNSMDQLTQRDNSLPRSTSYLRKKALQKVTADLTPIHSTPSSARASPQPYMNVSLSPPAPPTSGAYENADQLLKKTADPYPYEEVFFPRPNSKFQFQFQKRPETGELLPSDSSLSPSSSHTFSQLEQLREPTNENAEFSQSADLLHFPAHSPSQKLRAATIATVGGEEFSEEELGHFFLTYHWTEAAEGYADITSKASKRLWRGQVSDGVGVEVSVFRTRVSLSSVAGGLPPSILLTDLIMFQTDPLHPDNLGMLVRAGSEFQLLFFSAADSQSADQLIACLREAASDCDRTSSLVSSGSDDHFALLLGCSPVSAGVGKVSQGVEQTLSSHRLSQSLQVRIDLLEGFQIFPFGRSEPLCTFRRQQVKSAGVWERDPRVLGVVLQLRAGRHICYTFRFNRVNQLIAAFSHIRHLCRGEAGEEKKQRAGFLKGLFGKQAGKPRSNSDTSRSSTPPVDQVDSDAFTLLFLGATEPDDGMLTPECVLREYNNLLAGRNVAENVSPAPTTILTVSESCVRLTDRDKTVFRRRVYQRRTVVACERAAGENILGLLTQRPGTDELKCSLFKPVFSEAGLVSSHICQRLELADTF